MKHTLIVLGLLSLASGAMAAPVSMVARVVRKPEVKAKGQTHWMPLHLLQKLEPGDTIRCGPGGEATLVQLADGMRYAVRAGQQGVVGDRNVQGATSLGGLRGPSLQAAQALVGSRTGNFLARPASSQSRLNRQFPGWLLTGETRFSWEPVPRAEAYTFTLMDTRDNVLWSQRVTSAEAVYPPDMPVLETKQPYIWRLVPFGKTGKPLDAARWGVLTVLAQADAEALTADDAALRDAAQKTPNEPTPLLLLAERYRQAGVMMKTLEILEDLKQKSEPGASEALNATYAELGHTAQMLAGLLHAASEPDSKTP